MLRRAARLGNHGLKDGRIKSLPEGIGGACNFHNIDAFERAIGDVEISGAVHRRHNRRLAGAAGGEVKFERAEAQQIVVLQQVKRQMAAPERRPYRNCRRVTALRRAH